MSQVCFLFISMETTYDTRSTIILLSRASFQPFYLFYMVTTIGYAFSPAMNQNLHAVYIHKNLLVLRLSTFSLALLVGPRIC